jgi:serine/threonine protein kinase
LALSAGTRLGPYEVLSALGAGGMGEVYRARDSRLNRDVALKVLPEAFALDADRLARFKREAQVLASLNHPHIAAIYGFEDSGPVHALVLELVDGPTLADRLRQGAVPVDEALTIARQIADALQAAHDQNIIHRDLKPANIKLRPDGTVKVLDFGLAKALDPSSAMLADVSNSPTITSPAMMTGQGVILGTAAYMSPEQAKGRLADKRSDVWAFGCVLYEMLTGRRPFEGEDVSDTLASVLKSDPEWTAIPASVPATIRTLIRRCLEKDRKKRIADISTALFIMEEPARNDTVPVPKRSGGRAGWIAAAALLAVSAALGGMLVVRHPAVPQTLRFTSSPPEGWTLTVLSSRTSSTGTTASLSVSPDGRRIAFLYNAANGRSRLWVRSLDSLAPQELPGTDGAAGPFWSPDSRSLGFFADGKLKRIDVTGGAPLTLCESAEYRGGTWSQDGVIVFGTGATGPLQKVSASGGVPSPATVIAKEENGHGRPRFLPDGRHFFYSTYGVIKVYVGSLDSPERTLLLDAPGAMNVAYSEGHLLFMRDDTLMAQPFDLGRLTLSGEPVPVARDVLRVGVPPVAIFSVSDTGMLAYAPETATDAGSQLTWVDRAGKTIESVGERAVYGDLELSPDGARLAVTIAQRTLSGTTDIWLLDLARGGVRTRLTSDGAHEWVPIWSPDGRQIVFDSDRKEGSGLYRKSANGVGVEELLLRGTSGLTRSFSWSGDGRYLLYQRPRSEGRAGCCDQWILPLDGGKPRAFLESPSNKFRSKFSPDGRWVVYESNESGARSEIYVVPFPTPDSKVVVSVAGGSFPRWARNGKEIFYVDPDRRLMAAEVNGTGASFAVGAVRPLFTIDTQTIGRYGYDVAVDGQRFIVNAVPDQSAGPDSVKVVTNWMAGLQP